VKDTYAVRVPITVVLAEDNALLRHGLARLIGSAADLELVGAAADLPGCLALVEEHGPDVVVTDIRMPPGNTDEGIQAAARLRETHPEIGVVVLSQYANPSYALALLAEGSGTTVLHASPLVHSAAAPGALNGPVWLRATGN